VSADISSKTDREVVVITGASSGIGWGTALKFAHAGMAVVGVARDAEKLKALEAEIGAPDRVATLAMDVMRDEAPTRIVELAVERFGKINYLVNNAGVGRPKPLHETDDETLDYFLNLMLRSPFRLCRDALPHMPPGSAIINITSTFAVTGGLRGGAYSAAKAGLHGLTTHIACQYGATGVRCNSVAPGVTDTPMIAGRMDDIGFRKINQEMTPHTRLATVDDIASTIFFLCTPGGSFINAQQIVVDGGWTATKYLSEFGRFSTWTPAQT
jgi:NAD(P)-dependent dehydrogenase (short-subunit alcohol dehydrogenase family)